MRLLSIQGLQTKSKPALLRYIIKHLRRKSKRHLVMIAYNISKSKLPRLKTKAIRMRKKQRALTGLSFDPRQEPRQVYEDIELLKELKRRKGKTKRKFSRKQLAAQRLFAKRARAGTLRRR